MPAPQGWYASNYAYSPTIPHAVTSVNRPPASRLSRVLGGSTQHDAEQIKAAAAAEADASRQRIELEAEKKARERREQLRTMAALNRLARVARDLERLARRDEHGSA